jgi:hypothetical protein
MYILLRKAFTSGFLVFVAFSYAGSESSTGTPQSLPQFQDFPVTEVWRGPAAPVLITTRSERMFRTRLSQAGKESPDFAGHYRFAGWGCGTVCGAGGIVDLQTGVVYPPPLGGKGEGWERWIDCAALFPGNGYEYRLDSRLMIVRCGWNYDSPGKNWPDIYYLLWEGTRFKELLHIKPPRKQ